MFLLKNVKIFKQRTLSQSHFLNVIVWRKVKSKLLEIKIERAVKIQDPPKSAVLYSVANFRMLFIYFLSQFTIVYEYILLY